MIRDDTSEGAAALERDAPTASSACKLVCDGKGEVIGELAEDVAQRRHERWRNTAPTTTPDRVEGRTVSYAITGADLGIATTACRMINMVVGGLQWWTPLQLGSDPLEAGGAFSVGFQTEAQARLAGDLGGWTVHVATRPSESWTLRTIIRAERLREEAVVEGAARSVDPRAAHESDSEN